MRVCERALAAAAWLAVTSLSCSCTELQCTAAAAAAAARCVCTSAAHSTHHTRTNYNFTVDGENVSIKLNRFTDVRVRCESARRATLDSDALPRFRPAVDAGFVALERCAVPRRSYADVLHALNVAAPRATLHVTAAAGDLRPIHLVGLESVHNFNFIDCHELRLAPDAFDATPRLASLFLDSVSLDSVDGLPSSLQRLTLSRTGITHVTRANMERLTKLTLLEILDSQEDMSVEASAPLLAALRLEARRVWLHRALPDTLARLSIVNWSDAVPAPWEGCAALDKLVVKGATVQALPQNWVARCRALRHLSVQQATALTVVHPHALRTVRLTGCALRHLPPELLHHAPRLLLLDLRDNHLLQLPSKLLIRASNLVVLDLRNNSLSRDVVRRVAAAASLRRLLLDHNPLGDTCARAHTHAVSVSPSVWELRELSELRLRNTSASFICREWRRAMPRLRRLDLRHNHVTRLTYSELQFSSGDVELDLTDNNVTQLLYSHRDYTSLLARGDCEGPPRLRVTLTSALRCDCRTQWAVLALRACPGHVHVHNARCHTDESLYEVPPEVLTCPAPTAECPVAAPCRCDVRGRSQGPGHVVRVVCEHANLTRVPGVPGAAHTSWELLLAHNHITELRRAHLPPNLVMLDLRRNNISRLEPAAVLSLPTGTLLGHNPLACGCRARAALRMLHAHRARIADYQNMTCAGGAKLSPPTDCD
ncbi:uncharacterized protein LOC142984014 [Anticarsia gemmatalis]|uniref:uncharacterized protein LOC142984014 n=1 Tax=Anticarsia gemmatalis TaxID=129554 RepID=UPI003F7660AB